MTRRWRVHLIEQMILLPERRRVNLKHLLEIPKFDYEDRTRIAIKPASSTFQLQETPWLGNKWSSSNIAVISVIESGKLCRTRRHHQQHNYHTIEL